LKYRLAIFDSDGTLADTLPWLGSIFNELADEHGFRRIEAHELERFRNLHGHQFLRELDLPVWKLPRVMTAVRRRMAEHTGKLPLFPGIGDMLHRLAASGIQLAVVSSNSRENVQRILGADNAKLITQFLCGASMFGKAAKLRQVVRASLVAPGEAIYIGDEVRDAEAARKAGLAFGAVAWGLHDAKALRAETPAAFFATVREIADTLC